MVGERIRDSEGSFRAAETRSAEPSSADEISDSKYPEHHAASNYKAAADRFGVGMRGRFYSVAAMVLLFNKHYGPPILYCL